MLLDVFIAELEGGLTSVVFCLELYHEYVIAFLSYFLKNI